MKKFREWLSDYLRYFMLLLAALLVFALALIGVKLYQNSKREDLSGVIEILTETGTQGRDPEAGNEAPGTEAPSEEEETVPGTEGVITIQRQTGGAAESGQETTPEKESESGLVASPGSSSPPVSSQGMTSGDRTGGASGSQTDRIGGGETSASEIQPETQLLEIPPVESLPENTVRAEPVTETETETETEPAPVYMTLTASCYIRSGPGYEYEIIGEYTYGTVVQFLEDAGGWYKVQIDGMTGYMGARFFH